jgi:protein pelota
MRIKKREIKDGKGEIKLVPESLDDLWHLKYLVDKGDLVLALTYRREERARDKLRPEKLEKKPVRLGIMVEDVDFHRFSNRLRIRGTIVLGEDIGSYHTINVEPDKEISISKTWSVDQMDRLNEAVQASDMPKVIIVTIEEGEAIAGILRQFTVEESFVIRAVGRKKDGYRRVFFGDVSASLYSSIQNQGSEAVVIAGPGFTKNDFMAFLKERYPEIYEKSIVDSTSSIGISGFKEVLRRGTINKITKEMRISREVELMEELLERIAKDGNVAYGHDEVMKAMDYGAIDKLLIADETLRQFRERYNGLLRGVKEKDVVIFSTEFEPGKRLLALGGLAAMLRFKIW